MIEIIITTIVMIVTITVIVTAITIITIATTIAEMNRGTAVANVIVDFKLNKS